MFQSLAILCLSISVFLIAMKLFQIMKLLEIQARIRELEKNREYIKIQKEKIDDIYSESTIGKDFKVSNKENIENLNNLVNIRELNRLKETLKNIVEGEGYKLEVLEFSKVLDNKCDCPDCRKDNKNAKKK